LFYAKIIFTVKKIHKNRCKQSCSFWFRYQPNRSEAGALLQTPLGELTALPRPLTVFRGSTSKGRKKWERERRKEGVGEGRRKDRAKKGRKGA